jgi:hypothetical protein
MRRTILVVVAVVLAFWAASSADANADGILTDVESGYVADGYAATCYTMDVVFDGVPKNDAASLIGILQGVADRYGLTADNAMDVVNEQVYSYCPKHWDNLVAAGQLARGETGPVFVA